MKKLKLKALELSAEEMLTREQLKNVLGGSGDDGSGCSATTYCYKETYDSDTRKWVKTKNGEVSCTGTTTCTSGTSSVTCDGSTSSCTS